MTAVIIILCIVLFFGIILFIPDLKLTFIYDKKFDLKIHYAGIRLYSSKKKKSEDKAASKPENKPEGKPESNQKKESAILNLVLTEYRHRGFLETLKYFAKHIYDLLKNVSGIIGKLRFSVFNADITVATSDAADTAIQYGAVCAAAYPTLSLLEEFGNFGTKSVNISTDFIKSAYEFKADIRLRVKLIYLVIIFIKVLTKYHFLLKEAKKYERK